MKTLFIILSVLFSTQLIMAQNKMACCNLHASQEFAMLSKDEKFKAEHQEPKAFSYTENLGSTITFPTADGKDAKAFVIMSEAKTQNFLFVIHEWWGLNGYIKQESANLFKDLKNVNVMALDLYDGKVATNREDAAKYMQEAKPERLEAIIKGAIRLVGSDAKIGTIGWCFGGSWSMQASLLAGDQAVACVMYYGMPEKDVEKLKTLKPDVLAIFASKDDWINEKVAKEFKENMVKAGKTLQLETFEAKHAFANPSNPDYNKELAQQAHQLSLGFLKARF